MIFISLWGQLHFKRARLGRLCLQAIEHRACEPADLGLMGLIGDQQPQGADGDRDLVGVDEPVVRGLAVAGGAHSSLG